MSACKYSFLGLFLVACSVEHEPAATHSERAATADSCVPDRAALLALDYQAFDQDMNGGWRAISYKEGCELAAAELISDYIKQLEARGQQVPKILPWHEGQLYASEGQSQKAIALFGQSYGKSDFDQPWNLYVDASIAFLKKDRRAFDTSYDALKALPEPSYWAEMVSNTEAEYGYRPVWPQNLNVFDAFDRCFDKTYAEAYGQCNRGISNVADPDSRETEASESP